MKKDKVLDIISHAYSFITTFIVAVIAVSAVSLIVLHFAGISYFTVESGSMSPKYPMNSLVFVKEVAPEDVSVGDVITYVLNEDGVLVTHRVISIDTQEETFTTKGDANASNDPNPVLWGNMVGKVVMGLPGVGGIFRIFTSESARPYLIAVVIVFGVLSVIGDIYEKKRKKKAKALAEGEEASPVNK